MNYLNKFELKSKVSVVTGGAGGIGEEICKALLDAGSKVILADIDEKKSIKIVKKLSKKNKNIFYYNLNALSEKSIFDLKKIIIKKFKKIDVLINAIGICKNKDAVKFKQISYDEAIAKKLKVMDSTAFTLSKENELPIIVFNMNKPGNLKKIINGKEVGTIVN